MTSKKKSNTILVKTCRCDHSQEWCVFHSDEPIQSLDVMKILKNLVTFVSVVALVYLSRAMIGTCIECIAKGTCCGKFYQSLFPGPPRGFQSASPQKLVTTQPENSNFVENDVIESNELNSFRGGELKNEGVNV